MLTTALIFSAGRGERLNPLTLSIPKPMLKIENKPLLAYHIEKLARAGFTRIIINHAYLGHMIKQYFKDGQLYNIKIDYFAEPPGGLETGGTLAAITKNLIIDDEYLLCINADIFTDFEFKTNFSLQDNMNAHLILTPSSKYFHQADFGLVKNKLTLNNKKYIYSGIGIYRRQELKQLPIGRFSIREWLIHETQNNRVSGELYNGLWYDIGTLERLKDVEKLTKIKYSNY